ncbi:polymer-forming cytoskeletal protein [Neobacillus dielmonensis]|uniref:polymer-forming cytoskeletal protein n=1 Tax=Neobacillus dielmonensis TaxID=1347369 RepID=UPI0005A6ECA4|nr:polymer-forming cytoskeletal protein [Neobacillus dielmonensis]
MELKKRGDLTLNGLGSANGGQFHHVKINGTGTVNTDIDCTEFECHGSGSVNGNVTSHKVKISGNGKVKGTIETGLMTVEGTAKIGENLFAKTVEVSGKAVIGGRLKAEEIKVKGMLVVKEDCEAELFKAESHFSIGGLLNADHIEVSLFGECKVKEIGGQKIFIKQKAALLGLFKSFLPTQLEVDLIEGDEIEVENTKAAVIRGNHVTIGPKCQIGLVEYKEELTIDKKATVKEYRKV